MRDADVGGGRMNASTGTDPQIAPSSSPWVRDLLGSAGAAAATVLLLFLVFEGLERSFVRSEASRRLLHYARGVSTGLVTAMVVGLLG